MTARERERTLKTAARYLGARGDALRELLERALDEVLACAAPAHTLTPVSARVAGDTVFLGGLPPVRSASLARLLVDCQSARALLGTLGMGVDLRIRALAPRDAALAAAVNACAGAYIDVYLDGVLAAAEQKLPPGQSFTPRFSPGYGDAPLSMQRDLLRVCGAGALGVRLTRGLLMLPEKSVSAVVGVTTGRAARGQTPCALCERTDCMDREEAP